MEPTRQHGGRRLAAAVAIAACLGAAGQARVARADDESWQDEFAAVCSRTQDAMALSDDELRDLVNRCDKLKPVLDKLDEPLRKVYTRRAQACRDLYQFVLDSRKPGATG